MASGLYIHVPICASRCIYCDFYSTTIHGVEEAYVDALLRELDNDRARAAACLSTPIRTLYIGGGTPSQLGAKSLRRLLAGLSERLDLSQIEEATLEVNPEDVNEAFVSELLKGECLINRISMGVQSFNDKELSFIHRRHNAAKPAEAIEILRRHGIRNISIDLMYGLPLQTMESWSQSIQTALALGTQHISAYCLSVEQGTPLSRMNVRLPDDEECIEMAALLRQRLRAAGYEQYEISNYTLPGYHSRHNSAYWDGTPYLGLGPGAHSYDGQNTRYWNDADLKRYLNADDETKRKDMTQCEHLSPIDVHNERVMLGLRTRKGIEEALVRGQSQIVEGYVSQGLLRREDGHLMLTEAGLNLGDEVTRDLFL